MFCNWRLSLPVFRRRQARSCCSIHKFQCLSNLAGGGGSRRSSADLGYPNCSGYRVRCFSCQLPYPSSHLRISRYWTRQCVQRRRCGLLVEAFSDFETSLPRLRDVLKLVTVAAVLATAVAASVGVTALTLAHTKAWAGYGSAWRIWWLGDAMGVLVVAPLLLTGRDLLRVCRGWRLLEACLLSIAILVTSAAIFGPWAAVRDDVLAFVVFPFVIWAALRFRVAGRRSQVFCPPVSLFGERHMDSVRL